MWELKRNMLNLSLLPLGVIFEGKLFVDVVAHYITIFKIEFLQKSTLDKHKCNYYGRHLVIQGSKMMFIICRRDSLFKVLLVFIRHWMNDYEKENNNNGSRI